MQLRIRYLSQDFQATSKMKDLLCIINVCPGVAEVPVYHEVQLRPHVQDTKDHHGVSPPGEDPPGVVEDTLPGV